MVISNEISHEQAEKISSLFRAIDNVLGIIPSKEQKIPAEVQELVERREKLRTDKNYEEADKIRIEIEKLGFQVEDTIYGPLAVSLKNS